MISEDYRIQLNYLHKFMIPSRIFHCYYRLALELRLISSRGHERFLSILRSAEQQ